MSVIEAPAPARTEVTTREVLHRAADLLEEFGWCQGASAINASWLPVLPTQSDAVAFCALGALYRASVELGFPVPPVGEVHPPVLPLWQLGQMWGFGWTWNDVRGRTKAEVVARLREAAENA